MTQTALQEGKTYAEIGIAGILANQGSSLPSLEYDPLRLLSVFRNVKGEQNGGNAGKILR